MLYTMQSKIDRFFTGGQIFLLFSNSTVLVNPRTYMQIHTPTVVQGWWMDAPQSCCSIWKRFYLQGTRSRLCAYAPFVSSEKICWVNTKFEIAITGTIIANPSFYSDIRRFGWPSYTLVVVFSVWLCCLTGYALRRRKK